MTMVVLVLLVLTLLGAAWSTRRHRQLMSWDEELETAFGITPQRHRPSHRAS